MDFEYKINRFYLLSENYIEIINNLLDISVKNNILPLKILLTLPYVKSYLKDNKMEILEYSVKYFLENKNSILNFSFDNLDEFDELDDDQSDDNVSRRSCLDNISKVKKNFNKHNSNLLNSVNNIGDNEIIKIIIDIKNNSKKLDKTNINIIYDYIKLLIYILEEIKKLF